MGLRAQAAADLATFVEDLDGFGWPLVVTSPDGAQANLVGLSNDVAQAFDVDGQVITGRTVTVRLVVASLVAAFPQGLPRAVPDSSKMPWIVEFSNVNGETRTFKVADVRRDESLGCVDLTLELLK